MKRRLVCVGRVREAYVADAVRDFLIRLRRYDPVEVIEVPSSHAADSARAVRDEGDAILKRLDRDETVWLLERAGHELSSIELAERLRALSHGGTRSLVFVIAGTFGASDALLVRADFHWSLSRLTLLHEWARALVLEQLYRAAKIERGEPYHH